MVHLDLGNLVIHLRADTMQYDKAMNAVALRTQAMGKKIMALGRQMTFAFTLPLTLIGTFSVIAFAKFDNAMTKSLAIMGDVSSGMRKQMANLAREISKNSTTSATELANAYFFLASAGLSAEQSIAALDTVNKFAIAGAFDMAQATDLLTDAQSALGMTVDDAAQNMKNMTKIADVLTGANTLANASTEQFSLALTTQAGAAMKAFNIPLEEGVALLAAYADQGIKGQRAGTMLSRMLRLSTKGLLSNKRVWAKYNITLFDTQGELLPMAKIIGSLSEALGDMSTKQKIATLSMLGFQARSQQAILPLLGLGNRISEYTDKLSRMGGITEEIADNQMKSFASQMKDLWNNIVDVGIAIGEILAPSILKLNEHIKKGTKWWSKQNKQTQRWIIGIAALVAAIGPLLVISGALIKSLGIILGLIVAINTPILLLAGLAYTLRAAWQQNLFDIQGYWQTFYQWLQDKTGPLIKKVFDDGWFKAFTEMPKRLFEVMKHMGGFTEMMDEWAAGNFDDTKGGSVERFEKMAAAYMEGYDSFENTIKNSLSDLSITWKEGLDGMGTGVSEVFKELMVGLKNQVKNDMVGLLDLIKGLFPEIEIPDVGFNIDTGSRKRTSTKFGTKGKQIPEDMTNIAESLKTGAARIFRASLVDPRSMQSTNDILNSILKAIEKQTGDFRANRRAQFDKRRENIEKSRSRHELLRGQRRAADLESQGIGTPNSSRDILKELGKQTMFLKDIADVPVIS